MRRAPAEAGAGTLKRAPRGSPLVAHALACRGELQFAVFAPVCFSLGEMPALFVILGR